MRFHTIMVMASAAKRALAYSLVTLGINEKLASFLKTNQTLTILCFHRVSDERSPAYPPIPVKVFAELLDYLVQHYDIVDIHSIKDNPSRPQMILTFDDGYEDFYSCALPALKERKLPFVMSIIADCAEQARKLWTQSLNKCLETFTDMHPLHYMGKRYVIDKTNIERLAVQIYKRMMKYPVEERLRQLEDIYSQCPRPPMETLYMGWPEIKECADAGGSIFSHTYTHGNLGVEQPVEVLRHEIDEAKSLIEERTGRKVDGFTFPNGMHCDMTMKYVMNDPDYKYIFLVEDDINLIKRDKKILRRMLVTKTTLKENIFLVESYFKHFKAKFLN